MIYAYLLLVFALANDMFYLLPGGMRSGGMRTLDAGLALILLGVVYFAFRSRNLRPLGNVFTWWIVYYFLLVIVQVSIASLNYSQSIIDGLITARHQFYYLSFPLFLLALDDTQKVRVFMGWFSAMAIGLLILSLINYSGFILFHHMRAEGHGIRSGIVRAFIPAMGILVLAALWQFWEYLRRGTAMNIHLPLFLFIFGGIVFRQTRGRIIATFLTLVMMMVAKRRYRLLLGGFGVLMVALVGQAFFGEESILVNVFESAYTDIAEGGGTWAQRMSQIQGSWNVFIDNFLTGSGGVVIRGTGPGWAGLGDLLNIALGSDLGYWTWLKFYGYPGALLLLLMIAMVYWYAYRIDGGGERAYLGRFAAYHFTCVLISMVTINYMTRPHGIVLLCLTWAVLVRAAQAESDCDGSKNDPSGVDDYKLSGGDEHERAEVVPNEPSYKDG